MEMRQFLGYSDDDILLQLQDGRFIRINASGEIEVLNTISVLKSFPDARFHSKSPSPETKSRIDEALKNPKVVSDRIEDFKKLYLNTPNTSPDSPLRRRSVQVYVRELLATRKNRDWFDNLLATNNIQIKN